MSETRMVEMIFPAQSNHYGTLFGGHALALLAKAAFVAAHGRAGGAVVMARCEQVDFARPIRVGALLTLTARVSRIGRSSMTVEVSGATEGAAGSALSGRFEMVAVDGAGRPRHIDPAMSEKETT